MDEKFARQISQVAGSLCLVSTWFCNLDLSANPFPHKWQTKCFTFSWTFWIWILRWVFWLKAAPHWTHLKFLNFSWTVNSCPCSFIQGLFRIYPHFIHIKSCSSLGIKVNLCKILDQVSFVKKSGSSEFCQEKWIKFR